MASSAFFFGSRHDEVSDGGLGGGLEDEEDDCLGNDLEWDVGMDDDGVDEGTEVEALGVNTSAVLIAQHADAALSNLELRSCADVIYNASDEDNVILSKPTDP